MSVNNDQKFIMNNELEESMHNSLFSYVECLTGDKNIKEKYKTNVKNINHIINRDETIICIYDKWTSKPTKKEIKDFVDSAKIINSIENKNNLYMFVVSKLQCCETNSNEIKNISCKKSIKDLVCVAEKDILNIFAIEIKKVEINIENKDTPILEKIKLKIITIGNNTSSMPNANDYSNNITYYNIDPYDFQFNKYVDYLNKLSKDFKIMSPSGGPIVTLIYNDLNEIIKLRDEIKNKGSMSKWKIKHENPFKDLEYIFLIENFGPTGIYKKYGIKNYKKILKMNKIDVNTLINDIKSGKIKCDTVLL